MAVLVVCASCGGHAVSVADSPDADAGFHFATADTNDGGDSASRATTFVDSGSTPPSPPPPPHDYDPCPAAAPVPGDPCNVRWDETCAYGLVTCECPAPREHGPTWVCIDDDAGAR